MTLCSSTHNKMLMSVSRMPSVRMKVSALLLAFLSCCAVVNASSSVVINKGDSLKSLLCEETRLDNTTIVLNQSELHLNYEAGSDNNICLIENTHDVAIIPSQQVLDLGFKYVTVYCKIRETFGFAFLNIRNLTIRSVVFIDCWTRVSSSMVEWVNQTDQVLYYDYDQYFTLFFSHCYDLRLQNISVGVALSVSYLNYLDLLGVNLCGTTEIESIMPESQDKYPLLSMFIYFTDTKQVDLTECNLKIRSNTMSRINSRSLDLSDFHRYTNEGWQRLPVHPFADFSMLLTQSFAVNVSLAIGHPVWHVSFPVSVLIASINSIGSSWVSFEGYNLPYQICSTHKDSSNQVGPLTLSIVFFETPSFRSLSSKTPTPSLVIRNTAFTGISDFYGMTVVDSHTVAMLQIEKLTKKLSHQVRLENISWCYNELTSTASEHHLNDHPFPLLNVRHSSPFEESQLHLNMKNLLAHHNQIDDDYILKSDSCLVCFLNVTKAVMTGTNKFINNFGGTVLEIQQSNLWISGHLVVQHGSSFRGGGVFLDQTAMLYFQEPLLAEFYNNTADLGSAIYAPIHVTKVSAIQIVPTRLYSLANVSSINITLHFGSNIESGNRKSFYAPHLSLFGYQTSPNLMFESTTWDDHSKLYAYTKLIDAVLDMKERDKYMSLSNGMCFNVYGLSSGWDCTYLDKFIHTDADTSDKSQCPNKGYVLYYNTQHIYPGMKMFSVLNLGNQVYSIGYCQEKNSRVIFKSCNYAWSTEHQQDIVTFTLKHTENFNNSDRQYLVLFSNIEVHMYSIPAILFAELENSCPLGFQLDNGKCDCHHKLKENEYSCDIDEQSLVRKNKNNTWISLNTSANILRFSDDCPPTFCIEKECEVNHTDPMNKCCSGNRAGILCGQCEEGISMEFGSTKCNPNCTNLYLLTLPAYALAGLLLVWLLFATRITVATGTINGVIFYAMVLGLVTDHLTRNFRDSKERYAKFVYIVISLLNLNLGFPLCFYEGMTMAAKVGLQFVFPLYIWGIAVGLIVLSKFSTRLSKYTSGSSVQVLATLFHLSFAKVLWAVVMIFIFAKVHKIGDSNYTTLVWYLNGNFEYGQDVTHIILLIFASLFVLFFLLPYGILTTFSPCLERFRLVNRFRPFVDAYGRPFKVKWRFWFGLRLWLTAAMFCVDLFTFSLVAHASIILGFVLLQSTIRPFRSTLIGLLDTFFMVNYLLIAEFHTHASEKVFFWAYVVLTTSALLVTFCIILFHAVMPRKFQKHLEGMFLRERGGYEVIGEGRRDSDAELFKAAEQRTLNPMDTY